MDSVPTVLVVAASGRALAASARRAGYAPLVADYFGDRDTVASARAHIRLRDGLVRGMNEVDVLDALDALADAEEPVGVVYGSGFEDRPELLEKMARHWRLLGNTAQTVARVKDPIVFSELCATCGIPHPEVSLTPPQRPAEWLVKRRGGAGGTHVRPALAADTGRTGSYFQRRLDGMAVSLLILADRRGTAIVGSSSQWSSPLPAHPFRYGGAVRPAMLGDETAAALRDAALRLAAVVPLVGLNSLDFLVAGTDISLLEVNPRPGAALDVFDPGGGSLFAAHVAACEGRPVEIPPATDDATAAAIVYAGRDIPSVPDLDWPDWTADRQAAGTTVKADEPLCTVLASATTAASARNLLDRRMTAFLALANTWIS